jgi:Na+/melibiose symporter-like transporter
MDITINTPAILFPAISLIILAYTNRFLALSNRVRSLHEKYNESENKKNIHSQIKNMRYRIRLIKNMQGLAIFSILSCIVSMYCIYLDKMNTANIFFGIGMFAFIASLLLSLREIQLSTKALETELSDMEDLEDPSLVDYIKSKFDRE